MTCSTLSLCYYCWHNHTEKGKDRTYFLAEFLLQALSSFCPCSLYMLHFSFPASLINPFSCSTSTVLYCLAGALIKLMLCGAAAADIVSVKVCLIMSSVSSPLISFCSLSREQHARLNGIWTGLIKYLYSKHINPHNILLELKMTIWTNTWTVLLYAVK